MYFVWWINVQSWRYKSQPDKLKCIERQFKIHNATILLTKVLFYCIQSLLMLSHIPLILRFSLNWLIATLFSLNWWEFKEFIKISKMKLRYKNKYYVLLFFYWKASIKRLYSHNPFLPICFFFDSLIEQKTCKRFLLLNFIIVQTAYLYFTFLSNDFIFFSYKLLLYCRLL